MLPSLSLLWAMVPLLALSISPNQQMMLGGGLLAAVVALSNQGVRDKLKGFFSALPFPGKGASAADSISSVTTCQQAHLATSALMVYFTKRADSKGAMLATSIGQHLYTQQLEDINNQAKLASSGVQAANPTMTREEVIAAYNSLGEPK